MTNQQEFERIIALCEANHIKYSDEYFDARPQIEGDDRRKVFEAGFKRAWQHQQAKIDELKAEKEKLIQWVAQLGVECRRLGVHVTIEGLDYAATLMGMK